MTQPIDLQNVTPSEALQLSDEELDALAEITEQDVLRAEQERRRQASQRYRDLFLLLFLPLFAGTRDRALPSPSQQDEPAFTFDDESLLFRDSVGRVVAAAAIRAELDRVLDRMSSDVGQLAERLRNGDISLAEWQTEMMTKVKNSHLIAASMERGGWSRMSASHFTRVSREIRSDYGYLRSFASEIVSGRQKLDGTVARRARLYIQSGRGTYYKFLRGDKRTRGNTEERRVLTPADHCDDCVMWAQRGWQPIGTLPVPGEDSACRTNCKCVMVFRTAGGQGDKNE